MLVSLEFFLVVLSEVVRSRLYFPGAFSFMKIFPENYKPSSDTFVCKRVTRLFVVTGAQRYYTHGKSATADNPHHIRAFQTCSWN